MPRFTRLALVWLLLPGISMAGSAAVGPNDQGLPCAAEIQRFCAQVETGHGQLHRCLGEHRAELSPSCATKLKMLEARRQSIRQLCAADAGHFCGHLQPGKGRVAKCLREHRAELTPACAAQLGVSH